MWEADTTIQSHKRAFTKLGWKETRRVVNKDASNVHQSFCANSDAVEFKPQVENNILNGKDGMHVVPSKEAHEAFDSPDIHDYCGLY